ncbi:hypothetical protein [Bacteriophage Eos]|nr:hypothetical protein [Bacteriophage Eos]
MSEVTNVAVSNSEASTAIATNERDAKRWRAFQAAGRIRRLGFSGLREYRIEERPNYAHIGMEIWSEYGTNMDQEQFAEGNEDMKSLLNEFADRMIALIESRGETV